MTTRKTHDKGHSPELAIEDSRSGETPGAYPPAVLAPRGGPVRKQDPVPQFLAIDRNRSVVLGVIPVTDPSAVVVGNGGTGTALIVLDDGRMFAYARDIVAADALDLQPYVGLPAYVQV